MHNLVMKSSSIDHINGNGLDNRKCNLRKVTQQQNVMNARTNRKSTSKFKGVCRPKSSTKWIASITHNYKHIHIASCDSEVEAARLYNAKAKELFGEFARLNNVSRIH